MVGEIIRQILFDKGCPVPYCKIEEPHYHPICPECSTVDFKHPDCRYCSQFAATHKTRKGKENEDLI